MPHSLSATSVAADWTEVNWSWEFDYFVVCEVQQSDYARAHKVAKCTWDGPTDGPANQRCIFDYLSKVVHEKPISMLRLTPAASQAWAQMADAPQIPLSWDSDKYNIPSM